MICPLPDPCFAPRSEFFFHLRPCAKQRVLERGSLEDIRATIAHYTMPFMIAEAQQIRSLDPVTLAFAACLGNVKEETFRCYSSTRENRGTRKDFVDMARLLDDYSLNDIFAWYREKYPEANPALAMRSLSYFVAAETMPMPKMMIPFDWEEAKDRIRAAVRKLAI